jgi:hypothetical protein
VIRNSQNEKVIKSLIPYLNKIKQSTDGLNLGGAIAPNNRFYQFPIEIIEFYKKRESIWNINKKCTCNLYLSKNYQDFNPEKEAENESIEMVIKIKGNWTQDYELNCLKFNEQFYVSERHYHWIWWHWEILKYSEELSLTGNAKIDKEFRLLIKVVKEASSRPNINKDALKFEKDRINDFRMKLAYNKGTEFIETKYGWDKVFDSVINSIDKRIKNEA